MGAGSECIIGPRQRIQSCSCEILTGNVTYTRASKHDRAGARTGIVRTYERTEMIAAPLDSTAPRPIRPDIPLASHHITLGGRVVGPPSIHPSRPILLPGPRARGAP